MQPRYDATDDELIAFAMEYTGRYGPVVWVPLAGCVRADDPSTARVDVVRRKVDRMSAIKLKDWDVGR